MIDNIKRYLSLMLYSARLVAGRRYWIVIILPLLWPVLQAMFIMLGWRDGKLVPENAHLLMSIPLSVIAMGLGIRIIAGEVDSRTLEIAYTVPGGCHRIWLSKIATCVSMLIIGEVLLAIFIIVFFTSVSPGTLYGVLQASVFYLIVGMGFSAFFRSEITGAMITFVLYALNVFIHLASDVQLRISPFFDPNAIKNMDKSQILSHTIQNRIFLIILIAVLCLLTFFRVERREKMLRD